MISFFRRWLSSWVVLALLGLIMVAFVITGVGDPGTLGGLPGGGKVVASVGSESIGEPEAIRRVQTQLDAAKRDRPELDMAGFIAGGGVETTVDQLVNGRAIELFAAEQGMVASRKLVDGAITSIPAFNGPTGQFDPSVFQSILQQQRIPEAQLRQDFAREATTKMLLIPIAGAARFPTAMAGPYASLLLEARRGQLGAVPSSAFASATPPTDAELATFYSRNLSRYTVPERRIVRYALFDRSRFEGRVQPSEAEITAAYKANAATYAGRETRNLTQIIVPDERTANRLSALVRGGTPMADAARSAGLDALTVNATERRAFEGLSGAQVAQAAFSTARGSIAPTARSGLGFHIVRVDAIEAVAGVPLEEARAKITGELGQRKADEALAELVANIEDDVSGGSTFDEVARKYGLAASATPAITASGTAPDQPAYKAPAELASVLRDAFQADPDDDAAVATLPANAFAVYDLDRVVPAAPRPLAQIREQVLTDASLDRAYRAAKKAADAIAASFDSGTPLVQALAGGRVRLPPPQPIGSTRIELARAGKDIPPALALLFSMPEKRARVLALPNRQGWFVVALDTIVPGNAQMAQGLVPSTQEQLARVVGDEYVAQFANAVKARAGVKRNPAAISVLKNTLTGGTAAR